ncbi:hypothetical protein K1Y78_51045 [Streptomyces sp. tea 10]|nr:hypothetical protein [Streptomyces sp. tea 10]
MRWVLRLHDARDPLLLLVSERLKMGAGCCGMLGRTGRGVVGTLIAAASGDDHAARRIALRASGCVWGLVCSTGCHEFGVLARELDVPTEQWAR